MAMGPQEIRLREALGGAALADVHTAAIDWMTTARALDVVAEKLAECGPDVKKYFGGSKTAPAAQEAFETVSLNVTGRAKEMRKAKGALDQAGFAMHDALQTRDTMGAGPTDPGAAPRQKQGQEDSDYLHQQAAHSRQVDGYNAAVDKREADSRRAADNMDRLYEQSTQTMKQIHGEPDPVTQPPASSGGGGGAGGGNSATGGPSAPGHVGGPQQSTAPAGPGPGASGGQHTPGGGVSDGTGNPYPPSGPVIGSPQGPNPTSPAIPTPGAPTTGTPGGSNIGGPTAGGLAGALGGGMMGGMAGIGGAVRGPGMVAAPSGSSVGTGGRAIGSPGRSAGAGRGGALGRSAGRSAGGASGATGTRGTGRGGKAGGKVGSKGSAGNRSGGTGGTGGTGGGGGKNKSDKKGKAVDLFVEEQDWVDDEGAAPGVID